MAHFTNDSFTQEDRFCGRGLRQENGEFISTKSRHDVGSPNAVLEDFCDCQERIISGLVAETVIDRLEVINVDAQYAGRLTVIPIVACLQREAGSKVTTVEKAGE